MATAISTSPPAATCRSAVCAQDTYPGLLALLEREGLAEPEGDGPNRSHGAVAARRASIRSRVAMLSPWRRQSRQQVPSEGLPAKFFVTVDGGGAMPLDALGADLHLLATGEDIDCFWDALPSGLRWIGTATLSRTPEAVHTMLSGFAELRRRSVTEARRLRDVGSDLVRGLAARAALEPAEPPRRPAVLTRVCLSLGNGQAVLLALPFGRCSAEQLVQAAAWSERFGQGEIRLSFTRGILVPGIAGEHVLTLLAEASRAGFITDGDDPRLSLIACPGRPGCGSALTPAPADALRIAESCADILKDGAILHVSGCPKGCAHPGRADLTLVGREDGRYDVVPNGSTRDAASLHLSVDDLMTRLLPLTKLDDLRRTFAEDAQ